MSKRSTLTRKEELFLPWFLSMAMKKKVHDLLPPYYHVRLRMYFRKYGCISCQAKGYESGYGGNGLCGRSYARISERLTHTDRRMQRKFGHEQNRMAATFLKRLKSARDLLADLKGIV